MTLIEESALEYPNYTDYTHLIIHKGVYIRNADGDVVDFIQSGTCLDYLGASDKENFELVESGYVKSAGALPVNINAMKVGTCTANSFNVRIAPDIEAEICGKLKQGDIVYVAAIDYYGWGLVMYISNDTNEMCVGYAYLETFKFEEAE